MILSDTTIREAIQSGRITITPYDPSLVQPASIDVRLGTEFKVMRPADHTHIDPTAPADPKLWLSTTATPDRPFVLHPGDFALGHTLERIGLPDDVSAQLGGKSSLARLGVAVHATAGWVDGGFVGELVLEFSNVGRLPIQLRPGMKISQLIFMQMDRSAERPYGHPDLNSKYAGQTGAQAGLYHLNSVGDMSGQR